MSEQFSSGTLNSKQTQKQNVSSKTGYVQKKENKTLHMYIFPSFDLSTYN